MQNTYFYLIDDDDSTRRSFINVFKARGYHLETFASAQAFLALKDIPLQSIVIADVRMPEMSGIDLQILLKDKYPQVPVILMSGECSVSESITGMKQGAFEFLLKPFDITDLIKAIESAAKYLDGEIALLKKQALKKELLNKLAKREKAVAELMVAGHKNQAMAKQLGISADTVKQYRANVLSKLNMEDLSELIAFFKS
jgi:FixJ family two-component response regulator